MGRGYAAILDKTRYKLYCEKRSRAFVPLVKATCTRLYSSADSHGSTRASNKFRHTFIHAPLLLEPCAIVRPPSRLVPRCDVTKEFSYGGIRLSWETATGEKKCYACDNIRELRRYVDERMEFPRNFELILLGCSFLPPSL